MKYLFLFTIGPVKSFISESRKAQDLFASSALLSHLAKIAIIKASEVFTNDSFELITPFIKMEALNKPFPSIPNRFLFSIDTEENDIATKAQAIENYIIEDFSKIEGINKSDLPKGAKEQLQNHLDIRWVALPYTDENYVEKYKEINKILAGLKNYNLVSPHKETGRKCIVDGKNNVKFYRLTDKETEDKVKKRKLFNDDVTIYKKNKEEKLKIWHLQEGEGISAVTLKKRLHKNEAHTFPSTVAIAIMHLEEELKENDDYKTFRNKVKGEGVVKKHLKHSNDQLFYLDNIESIFKKEGLSDDKIKVCEKEHKAWSIPLKEKGIPLSTYYALIRFDGDNMGDWFSGKFKKGDIPLMEYQQNLSSFLIDFANTMKEKIGSPYGKVIYAGGEDFMAMINFHSLKESVDLIRTNFKVLVSDKMQKFITKQIDENGDEKDREFTLSMGISIAHYKEPLQMVLDKTATMEKLAKNSGRKRFAIRVSKHSGSQVETCLPWENDNFDKIYDIISLIENNNISAAFLLKIYNYCEELDFDKRAKKIIKSKKQLYIDRAIEKGDKKTIFTSINTILNTFIKETTLKDFANLLLVIDFMQRHDYKKKTDETKH